MQALLAGYGVAERSERPRRPTLRGRSKAPGGVYEGATPLPPEDVGRHVGHGDFLEPSEYERFEPSPRDVLSTLVM